MKQLFRITAAGLALTAALTASAFAADFTESADHLKELGLFQGTEQGYELDRAPTRAEAATMLVRLLGMEQKAESLSYTAPFTDLENWEKPYVQYLYDNQLTTGATATTFEPESPCTAQMYAAFLLRALGYSETAGDFIYRDASDFAEQCGVYNPATVDEEKFLRDHVAAASYTALSIAPKSASGTLLDQLTAEGAVDKTKAEPYQKLFQEYAVYHKATAGMDALTALETTNDVTASVSSSWENRENNKLFTLQSSETNKLDLAKPALLTDRVVTMTSATAGEKSFTATSYTADGMRYVKQNGQKSRAAQTAGQMDLLREGYARVPVALVDAITTSADGGYGITYSKAALSRLGETLSAAAEAVGGLDKMTLHTLTVEQTVADGLITSQKTTVEFDGGTIAGTLSSVMKLTATNEKVALTPPANLDQYPLVK